MSWINKIFNRKNENRSACKNNPVNSNIEPDYPCRFGYKSAWYAIKNETPVSVIEKLALDIICESNWNFGFEYISNHKNTAFLSPKLDDYVLVIGLSGDAHKIVNEHAKLFDELQYFASHRVVDYYAWARFLKGNIVHAYGYCPEKEEIVFWDEGILTEEEIDLGFDAFLKKGEEEIDWEKDNSRPGEENVIKIAKAWGCNPMFEDGKYEKSTGCLCRFKSL